MKTFNCDACGAHVFFENDWCLSCGHKLGFLPDIMAMSALEPDGAGGWKSLAAPAHEGRYRTCANGQAFAVCNWFIPAEEANQFCAACRLNLVVPDDSQPGNHIRWHRVEVEKRRLIYTLLQLGLLAPAGDAPNLPPLRFRFLADTPGCPPVLTAHERGVITLNIAEADDVEREVRRVQHSEQQRTLIGHFRHESGHYYWDALIAGSPYLERFRALFGDERADYAEALRQFYANGPAPDWPARCISAYASAHPWEDWAETWAHYLHMTDLLDTAAGYGVSLSLHHPATPSAAAENRALAVGTTFESMLENWFPLTQACNSLNRSQGLPDLYPYILSDTVAQKMRLVYDVIQHQQCGGENAAALAPAPAGNEMVAATNSGDGTGRHDLVDSGLANH